MGSRINYVFDDGTSALVVLYSHYGETTWKDDIAAALDHARTRQHDDFYFTRMIISYLIKDQVLDSTGFGIYAISREEMSDLGDTVVTLNLVDKLVIDEYNNSIPFYAEVLV